MTLFTSIGPNYKRLDTRNFWNGIEEKYYSFSLYGDITEEEVLLMKKTITPKRIFLLEICDGYPWWGCVLDEFVMDDEECMVLHRLLLKEGYKEINDAEYEYSHFGDLSILTKDEPGTENYLYNHEEEYDRSLDYEPDYEDWSAVREKREYDPISGEILAEDQNYHYQQSSIEEEQKRSIDNDEERFWVMIDKLEHTKRKMAFLVKEFLEADNGKNLSLLREFLDDEAHLRRLWHRQQESVRRQDPEYIHLERQAKDQVLDIDLIDNYGYKLLNREIQEIVEKTFRRELLNSKNMRLMRTISWPF